LSGCSTRGEDYELAASREGRESKTGSRKERKTGWKKIPQRSEGKEEAILEKKTEGSS